MERAKMESGSPALPGVQAVEGPVRCTYHQPQLHQYGRVRDLTRSGGSNAGENSAPRGILRDHLP